MQESAFVIPGSTLANFVARWREVGRGFNETDGNREDPYSYRLLLRFAAINLGGLAMVAGAWYEGLLDILFTADTTGLVRLIVALFVAGLIWCGVRIVETSREINEARRPLPSATSEAGRFVGLMRTARPESRQAIEAALKHRLAARLTPVRHAASMLVMLGLVGTVVGFVIALSGVDPEAASDVSAVAPMVSTLIDGLGVALHTTLVGSILNLWLMLDYRILESGMLRVFTDLLERGASNERL